MNPHVAKVAARWSVNDAERVDLECLGQAFEALDDATLEAVEDAARERVTSFAGKVPPQEVRSELATLLLAKVVRLSRLRARVARELAAIVASQAELARAARDEAARRS